MSEATEVKVRLRPVITMDGVISIIGNLQLQMQKRMLFKTEMNVGTRALPVVHYTCIKITCFCIKDLFLIYLFFFFPEASACLRQTNWKAVVEDKDSSHLVQHLIQELYFTEKTWMAYSQDSFSWLRMWITECEILFFNTDSKKHLTYKVIVGQEGAFYENSLAQKSFKNQDEVFKILREGAFEIVSH